MDLQQIALTILFQAAVHAALAVMLFEVNRRQGRAPYLYFWGWSATTIAAYQSLTALMVLVLQPRGDISWLTAALVLLITCLTFLQPAWLILASLSLAQRVAPRAAPWVLGSLGVGAGVVVLGLALSGNFATTRAWSWTIRYFGSAATLLWFAHKFWRAFGAHTGRAVPLVTAFSVLNAVHHLLLGIGELNPAFPWRLSNLFASWIGGVVPLGLTLAIVLSVLERAERSRRQVAGIWEATIEAMRMCDLNGRIVRVNAAFCHLFGKSREELVGQPMTIVYDAGEAARIEAGYRTRTGLDRSLFPLRRGFEGRLWNGHFVCLDASHALLESGHGTMVLSVFRDDTARRATEEALRDSQERLELALDSANDALFDWHVPERVVEVNPRYFHMLGYDVGEVELRPSGWIRLIHPDDYPRVRRDLLMQLDVQPERFDIEYRMRKQCGAYIWVAMRGKVTHRSASGKPLRIVGTLMEITDRKQAEQELARTTELAQAAARAKAAFLANMSHEIRTPLTAILGLTQLLDGNHLPVEARDTVALMRQAGDSLLGVINDILELSQIEAGVKMIRPAPFDPAACAAEVVRLLRLGAADRGLELKLELQPGLPEFVEGDAARIRQVLVNLLGNALKFTDSGRVVLRAEVAAVEGGRTVLQFSVTDTGIGIDADLQARLFRPFTQADSSASRRHGGTGLGLAISRRLVEQMGGQIGLRSELGRGSTFHFNVPLKVLDHGPEAVALAAPANPEVTSRLRVLVAEDNAVNRLIAGRLLHRFGVNPDLVEDGHQAVATAVAGSYDLVLMDVQMPGLDGMEAARQIRASAGTQPRIVALTAHVLPEDRDACLKAGMDGFLSKPLELHALARLLEDVAAKLSSAGEALDPAPCNA